MTESSKPFPHIQLRLAIEGSAKPVSSGVRKKTPQTAGNLNNRQGHGKRLKSSLDSITSYWQETQEQREEEEKPTLPNAIPLILKIDPSSFDPDDLKTFGSYFHLIY